MHVLVAAHDLYPDPGSGGTGRYVYETGRRLVERGHEVTVVTRCRGDEPRRGAVGGMDVRRIELSVAGEGAPDVLRQVPDAARPVRWALRDADPDLLSLQGPVTGQLVDALAPDDVPRSCTFHSPWSTEYEIRTRDGDLSAWRRRANVALRQWLEGRLLGRTDAVQTLSEFMRGRLRDRHGRHHDPGVVPGGVDAEQFHPGADEGAVGPAANDGDDAGDLADRLHRAGPSLLTVRRLSPRMGHDVLLHAFADLDDASDARLFVAGDGPLRDDLETLAADLGIEERVTVLGYVPDAALPAVHAAADLFVVPTTELEGFGLATLEAMASGTPVVATPVGGTVEVLSRAEDREAVSRPLLAAGATAAALRERLEDWVRLDPDRRAEAGRACRRYAVEEYPWARTVDAVEARYASLVGGGEGAPDDRDGTDRAADGVAGAAKPRRWQVQR